MIRKEQTEMNSLDFFFYSLVTFQVKVLKKDLDDSRWSGALVTSFFLCCFVFGVFTGGSLFYRNRLADWFVESATLWMTSVIVMAGLVVWRYFGSVSFESLVARRQKMRHVWVARLANWLFVIGGPVLSFITFRLYLCGHL